ncbi:hypothetical protein JYU14_04910, partial [Simkania negevensis]|nr:hypothetical protein [Simkania negevensis]
MVKTVLRESSLQKEGPLYVSKFSRVQLLVDREEMRSLLGSLNPFGIYAASGVVDRGSGEVCCEEFLAVYDSYVGALQAGSAPIHPQVRCRFSDYWSASSDALYAAVLPNGRELVKACRPVIQLQPHLLSYSPDDGVFRSMVMGPDSISWGIQFSYPQLY